MIQFLSKFGRVGAIAAAAVTIAAHPTNPETYAVAAGILFAAFGKHPGTAAK